uniref:Uncharacterized protein n=1 Tax=Anguilla anguilla TaxID=7936 RepID=A0A0E9Q1J4_ANGAN
MAIYVKVKSLTYIILSLHKLMAGQISLTFYTLLQNLRTL